MSRRVEVRVNYRRDDGVVVSQEVALESPLYGRETVGVFKSRVKRRAAQVVNAVLGSPKGLKVDRE